MAFALFDEFCKLWSDQAHTPQQVDCFTLRIKNVPCDWQNAKPGYSDRVVDDLELYGTWMLNVMVSLRPVPLKNKRGLIGSGRRY